MHIQQTIKTQMQSERKCAIFWDASSKSTTRGWKKNSEQISRQVREMHAGESLAWVETGFFSVLLLVVCWKVTHFSECPLLEIKKNTTKNRGN